MTLQSFGLLRRIVEPGSKIVRLGCHSWLGGSRFDAVPSLRISRIIFERAPGWTSD